MRTALILTALFLACLQCSSDSGNSRPGKKTSAGSGQAFLWPNGARAAVCLTYDDGIDGHVDIVAPDLEAVNLRGSFYVPGSSESLAGRMDQWRAMDRRGHEIGNHSLFHPCLRVSTEGRVREWLKPEFELEHYTVRQMVTELRIANTMLQAVDGKTERTYAYVCSDHLAGGELYVDGIRPLFIAARTGGNSIVADMRTLDIHLVPSWGVSGVSGQEMIDFVNVAADAGTMAVFMFHGVGGGHNLNVSRQAHRELIEYLDAQRDRFWTDTFAVVMDHLRAERRRLEWD
jgi:peptidoglycan/xylan/chitin deacetylase (PgdA/CDA1 family)